MVFENIVTIKNKLNLATKLVLTLSIVLVFILWILGIFFLGRQQALVKQGLIDRGRALAESVAYNSTQAVLDSDKESLFELSEGALEQEDIIYCLIQDKQGQALNFVGAIESSQIFKGVRKNVIEELDFDGYLVQHYSVARKKPVYDIAVPIVLQRVETVEETAGIGYSQPIIDLKEEKIGVVRLGVSFSGAHHKIVGFRAVTILLILVAIGLGVLVIFVIVRIITRPMKNLILGTKKIARGDLTYRAEVESTDEIGDLVEAFNQMTTELKDSRDEIENYNRTLEQRVDERTKELKAMQAQLIQSAKMGAVGQLGAGVAHELNNPLGGILGYAQLLLEKINKPDFKNEDFPSCRKYIESILRESNRCWKIVENLLNFSRRPVVFKFEPVEIEKAILDTVSLAEHQLSLKNVTIATELKPGLAKVLGIVNQLQQVFTNLIINAQQAMVDGGEVKITAENVIDNKTLEPSAVKIKFIDTGCGIPEENCQRVFEPFFTTKAKTKGTGLGLSVTYQIIQDHKGTIEIESVVDKGTTFIITLLVPKEEKK